MSKFSENIVVKFTRTIEVCIPIAKPNPVLVGVPIIRRTISNPGRVVKRTKQVTKTKVTASPRTTKATKAVKATKATQPAKAKASKKSPIPARPVRPGVAKCKTEPVTPQQAKFWSAVARKRAGLGRGAQ